MTINPCPQITIAADKTTVLCGDAGYVHYYYYNISTPRRSKGKEEKFFCRIVTVVGHTFFFAFTISRKNWHQYTAAAAFLAKEYLCCCLLLEEEVPLTTNSQAVNTARFSL